MPNLNKAPEWATHLAEYGKEGPYWWVNYENHQWSVNGAESSMTALMTKSVERELLKFKNTPIIRQLEND